MERNNNELEWQTTNGLLQRGSNKRIREVQRRNNRTTNRNNSSKQEINESLNRKLSEAYIIGVMYGDGTLNKTSRFKNGKEYFDYRVKLGTIDMDFIRLYEQNLNVLGLSCNIIVEKRKGVNHHNLISAISQDKKTFEYVYRIKNKTRVHKMSKPELVMFLKGIFDSEGSVTNGELTLSISQNFDSPATPLIKYTLKKLGIKYSFYNHGNRNGRNKVECSFKIYGNESKKLYELFSGFTISRKNEKFLNNLNTQKQIEWSDEHEVLLNELKRKGFDYKTIANKLGRTKSSIEHKIWMLGLSRKR